MAIGVQPIVPGGREQARIFAESSREFRRRRRVDRREARFLLRVDELDAVFFKRGFKMQRLVDSGVIGLNLVNERRVADEADATGVNHGVMGEAIAVKRRQDKKRDADRVGIVFPIRRRILDVDPPARGVEPGMFCFAIRQGLQGRHLAALLRSQRDAVGNGPLLRVPAPAALVNPFTSTCQQMIDR